MLTKCANPDCNARFRYLHEGKLFIVDRFDCSRHGKSSGLSIGERLRFDYYWLCGTCSRTMLVMSDRTPHVQVAPHGQSIASQPAEGNS